MLHEVPQPLDDVAAATLPSAMPFRDALFCAAETRHDVGATRLQLRNALVLGGHSEQAVHGAITRARLYVAQNNSHGLGLG